MPKIEASESKSRVDLIDPISILEIGVAMADGVKAHGLRDWEKLDPGSVMPSMYGASLRHLLAWGAGESLDRDSGIPHLWKAGASVTILQSLVRRAHPTHFIGSAHPIYPDWVNPIEIKRWLARANPGAE